MSNITPWQQFQRSWETRSEIASDEGIKPAAVKATMTNDYDRLLAGSTGMSNQDAYAAMQSASDQKVLTPSPQGTGNIATNAMNDVRGIMTGIFHLPGQAISDVKQLGEGIDRAAEGKGFSTLGSAVGNLAQLIPGVTDVEQAAKGNWGYFYQHPIYSALDLAGSSDMLAEASGIAGAARDAAKTTADMGEQMVTGEEGTIPGPSAVPIPNLSDPSKAITFQNVMLSRHPIMELTKRAVKGQPTLNTTLQNMLGPWGLYGNSDLVRGKNIMQSMGQADFTRISSQLKQAMGELSPDETRQAWYLMQSGKNTDSIMADPTVSNAVKDAITGYGHMLDEYNKTVIGAGTHVKITHPVTGQEDIVSMRSPGAKGMRVFDTLSNKLKQSVDIRDQKKAGLDAAQAKVMDGPDQYDAPIGSSTTGKLQASGYLEDLRQTVNSVPVTGTVSAEGASRGATLGAEKRFSDLFSEAGPVKELSDAIRNHDEAATTTALSKVSRRVTSKFYKDNQQIAQLKSFIKDYRTAQKVLKNQNVKSSVDKANRDVTRLAKATDEHTKLIQRKWNDWTKDKYEVIIGGIMAGKLREAVQEAAGSGLRKIGPKEYVALPADEQQLNDVMELLNSGNLYPTGMAAFVDAKQWNKIRQSAIATYQSGIESGGKVFWVPKVTEGETAGSVRVGTDRLPSERATFQRSTNMSYSIQNPFLGLQKAWQEHLSRAYTDQYYEQYVKPRLRPVNQVVEGAQQDYLNLKHSGAKVPSWPEYFAHMYQSEVTKFNPADFVHSDSRHVVPGKEEQFISKSDLALLRHMNSFRDKSLGRAWDSSISLFRNAVLTVSPRFFAHITLGGAFMTLVKTGPEIFKYFGTAHEMITDERNYLHGHSDELPQNPIPQNISRGTGYEGSISRAIYEPQKFHLMLGGRTLGRLFSESIGQRLHLDSVAAKAHAYHQFLETWSDHYRVMAYLYGKDHAESRGAGLDEREMEDAKRFGLSHNEYAGVKLANKVLADNLSRSPLEQTAIRFIMPFGGWTKHVLRYVMTLPLDHPLRTNFLSNLSEQAYNADNSGLPEYLFHLLFLGEPDHDGNVSAIDFRQWNPLRDVANYMTLAGWVTQLNPLAQGVLTAMGINSATGAPELYPQLSYDSFYGGYQVQNPTGNTAESIVGSYVPEFGVLNHFLKLSSYTKSLARYDPQAFNDQLWSSLNFPWAPQQVNINQIIAKQETDRLNVMKSMVTSALSNNDPSYLQGLTGPWPYQGWYFTTDQVKGLIDSANEWQKKSGVDVPASDLIEVPTAPSVPLGVSAPAFVQPVTQG